MVEVFRSIHFNVASESDETVEAAGARPIARRGAPLRAVAPNAFNDEEAAARFYLNNILQRDVSPTLRGLTAPERPEVVPDLRLRDTQRSALTKTSIVRFVQTKAAIPIFGSRAIVEMDDKRELLGIDAELAEVVGVSPIAQVSHLQALTNIATAANSTVEKLQSVNSPELQFFHAPIQVRSATR
jgi:bacillolysin